MKKELKKIIISGIVIVIGLVLLKLWPMYIFGKDVLFDASFHLTMGIFILYILWFFIDQNKSWRIPYFVFAFFVLTVISIQRIVSNNHNDIGLLLGLVLGLIGIGIAEWRDIKNKFNF